MVQPITIGTLRRIMDGLPDDTPIVASNAFGDGTPVEHATVMAIRMATDAHLGTAQPPVTAVVLSLDLWQEYPD